MRTLVAFLSLAAAAVAQPVSFGIRGGIPLTDAFSTVTSTSSSGSFVKDFSNSKEYEIGAMVELHLPLGLAVEADALYHPMNLSQQIYLAPGNVQAGTYQNSMTVNSWEFPILGKYHFLPLPLVKPYVEAGPSFRALGNSASYFSSSGFTLGAGVEIKISRLRIEPDIRYTHWGSDSASSVAEGFTPSNVNQASFLVGIAF
jgi:opacity protein-like surface antigen